ncbi:uncharacterized protein BDW47DRAFT_113839 [Aspergillus candidus]|uniref:Uncharacterized protein n=1 Tax=Aspergillus candidus TaxID=41067 RepID=A0A2I2EYN4_ASPCN|nr:hypothetical protein BDW47DRAFT_113839 [Aspergillus candidus]PLB33489.1 hypothetical protein BDW47DRAFT_113839 [Aspergillus candidus]
MAMGVAVVMVIVERARRAARAAVFVVVVWRCMVGFLFFFCLWKEEKGKGGFDLWVC